MMSYEEAKEIFDLLIKESDFADETEVELWEDLRNAAIAYVDIRSLWIVLTKEQRGEKDSGRTSRHNVFMSALKIYGRYLSDKGKNTGWIDLLFRDNADRKYVGDFSGYFLLFSSLRSR